MAAQNKLFHRLIWLADTVYFAGAITRENIDRRWAVSEYNDLHDSQVETERSDDYSIFAFHLATTYDFIQELRKQGPNLEVLAPLRLRNSFRLDAEKQLKLYK